MIAKQLYPKARLMVDLVTRGERLERLCDLRDLYQHNETARREGRYNELLDLGKVKPLPEPLVLPVFDLVIETIAKL